MKTLKLGVIGLGARGNGLMVGCILGMDDIEIVAVCDEYQDRVEAMQEKVAEKKGYTPIGTTDYRELLKIEEIEAVIVPSAWEAHVEVAVAAMKAGKYVGVEVGGAYSIDDCWKLVHTSEETGMPCMMLENCCYGKKELMCLNMAKKGAFGEIVHLTGAYYHDLRKGIAECEETRRYRLRNYLMRNCENYPTHALGPLAKLININRGNRFVSLTSTASKARGMHDYISKNMPEHHLVNETFQQGDVITTTIKCANGETIRLTLGTTTPRAYSRDFGVMGTEGHFDENTNSIYLERDKADYGVGEIYLTQLWDNAKTKYDEEFNHPVWKKYEEEGITGGHGGMDWLVLRAFFESAMEKKAPPIDVYDTAAWMSITTLSEDSIAMGSAPVAVPDFTNGKWLKDKDKPRDEIETYTLSYIPEKENVKLV